MLGILVGRDTAQATSFNPQTTAAVADTTVGITSDINTSLSIGAPDSNFGASVTFVPTQWKPPTDAASNAKGNAGEAFVIFGSSTLSGTKDIAAYCRRCLTSA